VLSAAGWEGAVGERPSDEEMADWLRGGSGTRPNGDDPSFVPIVAKPYKYRDPRSIPPRRFLHASHYIRGFLSATVAPGGLGKTSLQLVEAIGMNRRHPAAL
jgi:hypothetical protein